jgi:dynein heavy chain 1
LKKSKVASRVLIFNYSRLKVFYEEELDVPLVLFNEVLDHVLRIDRIFRQPQGHLLLIGISGSGKTTLSRFVAWMNGLSVFQIKVHNKYMAEDFDEDLRHVLRRSGEKIHCFILFIYLKTFNWKYLFILLLNRTQIVIKICFFRT